MLPRPPLVPPEVECPANVAALYGPGIVLFGTAVVDALNCHAEGIEGIVTPKLSDTVAACGGASKWQGFVADCVAKLSKLPGSIAFNWISIDCTADGPSGACCLTCGGNSISFGGGRATSSPFNSYLQHTQSRKHEKARDALLAKVEAAAVASGLPRAEIAMQILAERAGLLPASELPHVELQPVGSEPLGPPTTRSIGWSAAQPNQPATKQEQLDEQLGTGAFTVNDDGSLAGCGRCSRHKPTWIQLSHPNWLKNAIAHYQSHTRPKHGMQRLEFFGITACSSRLCDAVAPAVTRDYSTICHGFWLESVTYSDTTYDTDALMNDWKPGARWYAVPRYKATFMQKRTSDSQELFALQGSSVQWQRDGIAASGTVTGYESPAVMFVQPDATSHSVLLEAGQLRDGRWAMISESEVCVCARTLPLAHAHTPRTHARTHTHTHTRARAPTRMRSLTRAHTHAHSHALARARTHTRPRTHPPTNDLPPFVRRVCRFTLSHAK